MENRISIYQQFILQCLYKVHWEEFCFSIPQAEGALHATQGPGVPGGGGTRGELGPSLQYGSHGEDQLVQGSGAQGCPWLSGTCPGGLGRGEWPRA